MRFLIFIFSLWTAVSALATENIVVHLDSSNLPIVIIETNGNTIRKDVRIAADMQIIWNDDHQRNRVTDTPNNYNGKIGIELHGQSSLSFTKKSYRIETRDSSGANLNVSLLGMPKENDWILYGPYSDKTLMRNVLSYTLASEISGYAPRTRFCELIMNRVYVGVYVLTEKIKLDKNRVNITQMLPGDIAEPEITGGYIFKKDKTDPGDNIIHLNRGLDLVITEPKNDEIVPEQTAWLRNHLNHFENILYSNGDYTKYIDVTSFVDNFLMVEFTKNIDGYRLSTYFNKDRNGKIHAAPVWDYNLSLGNADYNDGWTPVGWYYPIISSWDPDWWMVLLKDSGFLEAAIERWTELRTRQLSKSHIFSLIDEWTVQLEEAQERNFSFYPILGAYVWPNPGYPQSGSFGYNPPRSGAPTTWQEEIIVMKDFILGRLAWMDEQFDVNITGIAAAKQDKNSSFTLESNYPNPFNAVTHIDYTLNVGSFVRLTLLDVTGRRIKTLMAQLQPAGKHTATLDASDLPSGIYIYKLEAGKFGQSRKMIMLK